MRHRRIRRRFKYILTSSLVISTILFLETRIESIAPRLNDFAETRIEEAFDNRIEISIGGLEGGLLNPITINNCIVTDNGSREIFPDLEIDSIRTNYRLWDVIFQKELGIDIRFSTADKEMSGFARFEGDLFDARIKGYVDLLDGERIDFHGCVKDGALEFNLKSKDGIFGSKGILSRDGELKANLTMNHLKLGGLDIVCDALIKNRFTRGSDNMGPVTAEGEFETERLILNYRPFLDVKASYKISDRRLYIYSARLGSDFKVDGDITLDRPYDVAMVLTVDNANIGMLTSTFNVQDIIPISGIMNGKFELKGPMARLRLDATFEMRQGFLGVVDFEHLNAHLRGDGPMIRIEDSRITRQSGYFVLAGDIDLNKMGRANIFEDVRVVTDDRALVWDGWEMKRFKDIQEVRMKKKMSEEVSLGFKKFVADDKVDESLRDTDEVEFEYKLHPQESMKVSIGQDKSFWGLEHKDRF